MRAAVKNGETFTIVLGSATSLTALEEWFEGAAAGDRAIYASGFTCPREHESVRFAQRLSDAGRAHLTQDRDPNDRRRWQFFITKSSKADGGCSAPSSVSGRAVSGRAVRPDLTREQMRCLMNRLRKAAHDGEPCPSYADLAKHLCLRGNAKGRMRARYLVGRLEKEEQIAVAPGGPSQPPVITILKPGRARGKSTRGGTNG